jgi:hypothetical protein
MSAVILSAALAAAQADVSPREADQQPSELALQMQETLRRNPGVLDSLARRILESEIGARISGAADPEQRLADIRRWIKDSPESAAHVAVGLARDDNEGSRRFEEEVLRDADRSLTLNPDHIGKSTFGRLKRGSLESTLMRRDDKMSDEEKREIIKNLFEGRGGMSNQVINQARDARNPAGAAFSGDYYNRLSRLNLRGYSPQLLALQSSLNARRAPGAPRLVETGKLDYQTLVYPAYGMRYDVSNLRERLLTQQNLELARLAGLAGRYTARELASPEISALLQADAANKKLNPRFARRRRAVERAAAALSEFESAAQRSQDPDSITPGWLLTLAGRQKEAARWISVAALEEELQRLETESGFLSADLLTLIEKCPVSESLKNSYKSRGQAYQTSLEGLRMRAETALSRLQADDWMKSAHEIERVLAQEGAARGALLRNIQDYRLTPYHLSGLAAARPRWRAGLETLVERYLPGTNWGRRLRARQQQGQRLTDVFARIATGDPDAAHAILNLGEFEIGRASCRERVS